ncbi:hypothetical protein EW145_g3053 [Phellinidium pouzarii]|uniref:Fungal-type protein kinase domain-containing protein n=1 Tax=Phellinidium pouzarii TaxID=167371 RepID=A0A4S4L8H5_9AGAM|nr:hypothetical protein EW145_g3053 [Phellinidium pouzarii]
MRGRRDSITSDTTRPRTGVVPGSYKKRLSLLESSLRLVDSSSMLFAPGPSEQFGDEADSERDVFPPVMDSSTLSPSAVPVLNTTPVKAKHLENPYKHKDAKVTQDSVLGHARISNVGDFEMHYLQEVKTDRPETLVDILNEYIKSLPPSLSESEYVSSYHKTPHENIFTLIAAANRCLAFHDVSTSGDFEGSGTKPDIVAKWTTRAIAQKIANGETVKFRVYWHEMQSLIEVKRDVKVIAPSTQAGAYLHVLPRALPSLAGMLCLAWDRRAFVLYWSDTCDNLRSSDYDINDVKSWDVLFRYVYTVVNPLPDLPTRDPTMSIKSTVVLKPKWEISCNKQTLSASFLFAAPSHSQQTSHQACLKHKRILHRNFDDEQAPGAKIINRVLDPNEKCVKEEGILIDWDNAADLEKGDVSGALTKRTGTPMFVSIGVGMGIIRPLATLRRKFPVLTGEAERLYVQAYGQETYDKYLKAVNESEMVKDADTTPPQYRHRPYHDVESFLWVFVYELLVAWPEGSEGANLLIHSFKNHSFTKKDGDDFRQSIFGNDAASWKAILHPELECLAVSRRDTRGNVSIFLCGVGILA